MLGQERPCKPYSKGVVYIGCSELHRDSASGDGITDQADCLAFDHRSIVSGEILSLRRRGKAWLLMITAPFSLMQPAYPAFVAGFKLDHTPQLILGDAELLLFSRGEI